MDKLNSFKYTKYLNLDDIKPHFMKLMTLLKFNKLQLPFYNNYGITAKYNENYNFFTKDARKIIKKELIKICVKINKCSYFYNKPFNYDNDFLNEYLY